MPQVKLKIEEIYKKLCPECKKAVEDMVKEQLVNELLAPEVKKALEGDKSK